ncbi:MAG TPA: hypothetical protein VNF71_01770 [Acidimicrobiales bacterium]|nr:hypothetical protein [Acidimicrobiales bacterium]
MPPRRTTATTAVQNRSIERFSSSQSIKLENRSIAFCGRKRSASASLTSCRTGRSGRTGLRLGTLRHRCHTRNVYTVGGEEVDIALVRLGCG